MSAEPRAAGSLPPQYRTAIVGVLPFSNLNDEADEYFSDGLAEDLIHALSLQSFFRVLSRNATFVFKNAGLSARLIAREIDATYLIQGTVRRAGQKIRVTAELVAPENGEQLWADRYDRDIGDVFAVQDDITANLCAALIPEIYRAEAAVPVRSLTTDLTAWDRFLRGLSHYYRPTKADYERSIALFREAIALDPALAIAHTYLGTILMQGGSFRLDQEQPRIVGRGDASRRDQRPARAPLLLRLFAAGLCPSDDGPARAGHGGRPQGGRAESLRHGCARRAGRLPFRDRRARPCHRAVLDRRSARQQRSALSMGGAERVQPLSARPI